MTELSRIGHATATHTFNNKQSKKILAAALKRWFLTWDKADYHGYGI
jgi:hypothetical protein